MFPLIIDTEFCVALLENQHAETLAEVVELNRGHLGHRLFWTWEANLVDIRRFIACGKDRFARRNGFEAGVWAGNELAGGIGLYPRCSNVGTFELEYWLSFAFEGRGVMTRSLRLVKNAVFSELSCCRLEVQCDSDNLRSMAVARRLGFQKKHDKERNASSKDSQSRRLVYHLDKAKELRRATSGD